MECSQAFPRSGLATLLLFAPQFSGYFYCSFLAGIMCRTFKFGQHSGGEKLKFGKIVIFAENLKSKLEYKLSKEL
jgi:hypothetical protein